MQGGDDVAHQGQEAVGSDQVLDVFKDRAGRISLWVGEGDRKRSQGRLTVLGLNNWSNNYGGTMNIWV